MKKFIFGITTTIVLSFCASARAQFVQREYYMPGYGWYTPGVNRVDVWNRGVNAYQYYGGGMFGNVYYGPTPFQRRLGLGGVYNNDNVRFRVPNYSYGHKR